MNIFRKNAITDTLHEDKKSQELSLAVINQL